MKTSKAPRCARERFSDTRVINIVEMIGPGPMYIVREALANDKCCSNGILPNSAPAPFVSYTLVS